MPNMCYVCRLHQESALHLFSECICATQLRRYLVDISPSRLPNPTYTTVTIREILLSAQENKYTRQLETIMLFLI